MTPSPADTWHAYRSLRPDSWGPHRVFGGVVPTHGASALNMVGAFLCELRRGDIEPGQLEPGRSYSVPDAYTAALLLHLDQELCLHADQPVVYRGQAGVATWKPESSMERAQRGPLDVYLAGQYCSMLFEFVLQQVDWSTGPWLTKAWPLDAATILAAGRHHGMSSPLIDVTVDPAVAVAFALHQCRGTGAQTAKVFRFALRDLNRGALLTLPLPPMLRSARQHGLYYYSAADRPTRNRLDPAAAAVISFPSNSPFDDLSGLLRDGERIDLMHSDPLLGAIEGLVRSARSRMDGFALCTDWPGGEVPSPVRDLGREILSRLVGQQLLYQDKQRFRYVPSNELLLEWFKLATDILHALCGIAYHTEQGELPVDALEKFTDDNFPAMQVYLTLYGMLRGDGGLDAIAPVARVLNGRLLTTSKGYAGSYSPDLVPRDFAPSFGKKCD